jgi:hypothetical protein
MKKLLTVVAVGLMANVAMAGAGFDILGTDPIEVPENGTVEVLISTTGGMSGGMALVLQAMGGFEITAIDAAGIEGGYWSVPATATYENITLAPIGTFGPSSYGIAEVGSAQGNITLPAGAVLAKATISANGLGVGATGTLTTDADAQQSSLAAPPTAQDSVALVVVPEPVTALLILAGLPLIRRRRA